MLNTAKARSVGSPFDREIEIWLNNEATIHSAVLFGSGAAGTGNGAEADQWSDRDLHLITSDPQRLLRLDWKKALPRLGFKFQAVREATGGVDKLTVVFDEGQMDLIIVPRTLMRLARFGLKVGLYHRNKRLRLALNEIHTCLRSGYRFIKGESAWGTFYQRVADQMQGVRLGDEELINLANVATIDLLWVHQKISRGELSAAQHVLHHSVGMTNFRLLREWRLRSGESLPSFGLGRHVERLLSRDELDWVRIDARCEADELSRATEQAATGLIQLMRKLVPDWSAPEPILGAKNDREK